MASPPPYESPQEQARRCERDHPRGDRAVRVRNDRNVLGHPLDTDNEQGEADGAEDTGGQMTAAQTLHRLAPVNRPQQPLGGLFRYLALLGKRLRAGRPAATPPSP